MSIAQRLRQLIVFLVLTAVLMVVSRILFDLLAGRPMFWTSDEGMQMLVWHSLVGGPFILFALLVAAQRAGSGNTPP
jgi:RsiW-degrading membrane proteinase PrsW (M82 family)